MVPVGRLAILRSTKKYELIGAIATITWPGLAAPVLGPPLGGFITTYLSWRWVFYLNVPIGVVGMVLVTLLIKNQREPQTPPLDWPVDRRRDYCDWATQVVDRMRGVCPRLEALFEQEAARCTSKHCQGDSRAARIS